MSIIYAASHGLAIGEGFHFANYLPTDCGVDESTLYYVLPTDFTANSFRFSTSQGGAEYTLLKDITDGTLVSPDTFAVVNDTVMTPPPEPAAPTNVQVTTQVTPDETGQALASIIVTWDQVVDPGLRVNYVDITFIADPVTGDPDWTNPVRMAVPVGENKVTITGIASGQAYWVRVYATSVYGSASQPADTVFTIAATDTTAPTTPITMTALGAVNSAFLTWDQGAPAASDLAFYEVRYAEDPLGILGSGANLPSWKYLRCKTNSLVVAGLTADKGNKIPEARYWVQVRAVDSTGNVEDLTDPASPVAVNFQQYPDTGWCTKVLVDPVMVDSSLVKFKSLNSTHIDALDAGIINTGSLLMSLARDDLADGIKVYDGTALVGQWDESGLYVADSANAGNYVKVYAGGITVYRYGSPTAAITPDGINASAITMGAIPGGGNLVKNSSFELSDFSVPGYSSMAEDADFSLYTYGSPVNATQAGSISITNRTY